MAQNAAALAAKYFFVDLFGGIFAFPLWWYTQGLVDTGQAIAGSVKNYNETIALRVWVKNWFVPMYGARDFTGRAISIFMRTVVIFGLSISLAVYAVLMTLLLVAYLLLPLLAILFMMYHAVGFFF